MFGLLWLIIVGAVAGFIATRLMNIDLPLWQTVGVGVLGALVGGALLTAVLSFLGVFAGLIGAVLGAMLLIYGFQTLSKSR